MRVSDLIERDSPGDPRPDGASRQQVEEPPQVFPEPCGCCTRITLIE
jgi:hypothetical protein